MHLLFCVGQLPQQDMADVTCEISTEALSGVLLAFREFSQDVATWYPAAAGALPWVAARAKHYVVSPDMLFGDVRKQLLHCCTQALARRQRYAYVRRAYVAPYGGNVLGPRDNALLLLADGRRPTYHQLDLYNVCRTFLRQLALQEQACPGAPLYVGWRATTEPAAALWRVAQPDEP